MMSLRYSLLCLLILSPVCIAHARSPRFTTEVSRRYDSKALAQWNLRIRPRLSVPDDERFPELSAVSAGAAAHLGDQGKVIGRCVAKELPRRDIIGFLISKNVVRTNIHAGSTVSLQEEGEDRTGYWARLTATQVFYTNRKNVHSFDFAIHVSPTGTIRFINFNQVGNDDDTD